MAVLRIIVAWLSRWLDDAASALTRAAGMMRVGRKVRLVEQPNGDFLVQSTRKRRVGPQTGKPLRLDGDGLIGPFDARMRALLAGSQIEIVLKPERFIFRPLELPRRASDFLEGVVKAQIDRLTPWNQGDAAFGWGAPSPLGADRMVVTVAATAAAAIAPVVRTLTGFRADSIVVSTTSEVANAHPEPIVVFAQRAGAELRRRRLRRRLIGLLALTSVAATFGAGAAIIVGAGYDAERLSLERQFAERRAALTSGRNSLSDEALAALETKKRATPAGVIVLEALSQTLPDDTYLNELRIEDGRVQIAGLTRDAPALIKLIEQSQYFTRATFFAPTTRAPTDSGERFHIEAHIEPVFPTLQ